MLMLLVRDIMYCKPGKTRPMAQKFLALAKAAQKLGFTAMRVLTDVSGERYWTVVTEMEVKSLGDYEASMKSAMDSKEFQEIMKDYHDLVDSGRREIYTIEQ
jgi:hypothetical protein